MKIRPLGAEIHGDGQTYHRFSTIFRKAVIIDELFHHMSPLGMSDTYVHLCSPHRIVHARSTFCAQHARIS